MYRAQDHEDYAPRQKPEASRPVDYYTSLIRHVKTRFYPRNSPYSYHVPPHPYYSKALLPARVTRDNPSTAIATQLMSTATHEHPPRSRIQFTAIQWSPNGRQLLCATSAGEFYMFNGHSFARETKTTAHETQCRALAWGHARDVIASGCEAGVVKLWLPSMVAVAQHQTGQTAVRDISFAPGEARYATAGKDGTVRVWDTNRVGTSGGTFVEEDNRFEGHGGDVQSVHWHPYKALVLSGSNDNTARLWDPRASRSQAGLSTLEGHAGGIQCARWNANGHDLITAAKDCTVKLWDVRVLREITTYQGHSKEVTRVAWHPSHPSLFASSSVDGNINYWIVAPGDGQRRANGVFEVVKEASSIQYAHNRFRDVANPVHTLAWAPLGHLLVSASADLKFWHRNKPGADEEQSHGADIDTMDIL